MSDVPAGNVSADSSSGGGEPGVGPAIVFLSHDEVTRHVLGDELRRRYGADYDVVECDPARPLADVVGAHADTGGPVAVVLAAFGPDDPATIDDLAAIREVYPGARRGVVVSWGDFGRAGEIFEAVTLGRAEFFLIRPERRRDEEFHRSLCEVLEDWSSAQAGGFEAVRIIDHSTRREATSCSTRSLATTSRPGSTTRTPISDARPFEGGWRRCRAAGAGPSLHPRIGPAPRSDRP